MTEGAGELNSAQPALNGGNLQGEYTQREREREIERGRRAGNTEEREREGGR